MTKLNRVTNILISAVDHNIYSEDLFGSDDDDFMEDDGLTEPEILAMLDEVECKSVIFLFQELLLNSNGLVTRQCASFVFHLLCV